MCALSLGIQNLWAEAWLLASSPQRSCRWTGRGRWTRRSWPPTPGSPWWPPPLRWLRRNIRGRREKSLILTSRCPTSSSQGWSAPSTCPPSPCSSSMLFSPMLFASMFFSSKDFPTENSFLARLFLGVFVLEGIFLKFSSRDLDVCPAAMMVQALLCYFSNSGWSVFVGHVTLYLSSSQFVHIWDASLCTSQYRIQLANKIIWFLIKRKTLINCAVSDS